MATDDRKRLLGHRQRQEVGEVSAVNDAPGDVLRHKAGLDPLRDLANALDMRRVEPLGAAERQPDAMQRNREIAADRVETGERRAAAHVILGMDLHPRDVWSRVQDRLVVLEAQTDSGFRRNRSWQRGDGWRHVVTPKWSCRPGSSRSRPREAARRTWYRARSLPGRRRNARPRRNRSSPRR